MNLHPRTASGDYHADLKWGPEESVTAGVLRSTGECRGLSGVMPVSLNLPAGRSLFLSKPEQSDHHDDFAE
jgi:hypothetical protein